MGRGALFAAFWLGVSDSDTGPLRPCGSIRVGTSNQDRMINGGQHPLHNNNCDPGNKYADGWNPTIFHRVSAGGYHSCGLVVDRDNEDDPYNSDVDLAANPEGTRKVVGRSVQCWGKNDHGESKPPSGLFTQVSAGGQHTCGVLTDGTIQCWGNNDAGQCSPPKASFAQVSAGHTHTCGVETDGTVDCWGNDDEGQSVPPRGRFTQVSAGYAHTCAVETPGNKVVCWGSSDSGKSSPPSRVPFVEVSAGHSHTCGIKLNGGKVRCWGDLKDWSMVPTEGGFAQIDAGEYHTCAVKSGWNAHAYCWGNADDSSMEAPPEKWFAHVSAGYDHTCATEPEGHVECWGKNDAGQTSPPNQEWKLPWFIYVLWACTLCICGLVKLRERSKRRSEGEGYEMDPYRAERARADFERERGEQGRHHRRRHRSARGPGRWRNLEDANDGSHSGSGSDGEHDPRRQAVHKFCKICECVVVFSFWGLALAMILNSAGVIHVFGGGTHEDSGSVVSSNSVRQRTRSSR